MKIFILVIFLLINACGRTANTEVKSIDTHISDQENSEKTSLTTSRTISTDDDPYYEIRQKLLSIAEDHFEEWKTHGWNEPHYDKKFYLIIGKNDKVIGGYYDLIGSESRANISVRYVDALNKWMVVSASHDEPFFFTSEASIRVYGISEIDEERKLIINKNIEY